jgi:hypothetical protein
VESLFLTVSIFSIENPHSRGAAIKRLKRNVWWKKVVKGSDLDPHCPHTKKAVLWGGFFRVGLVSENLNQKI